ncbi:MAG: hypothetical protein U0104_15325 [Gemmatimonadales bacterium]
MRGRRHAQLTMGQRGAQFCREHPDPNPATAQVAERLFPLVARAGELADLQQASQAIVAAAVTTKAELRRTIEDQVQVLFGVARAAAKDHPEVAVHRRRPRSPVNETTLLTSARVAIAEAAGIKDLLVPYGLVDDQLGRLTADLEAYEAALTRQRAARTAQVTASSELEGVLSDLMAVVQNLDAVHRARFRGNPELLAAWKSVRRVAWPGAPVAAPATEPATDAPRAA